MLKQTEEDLPEPLGSFRFPRQLWRNLRTSKIIRLFFVEVRRRTMTSGIIYIFVTVVGIILRQVDPHAPSFAGPLK